MKPLSKQKLINLCTFLRLEDTTIREGCANVIPPLEYQYCSANGGPI